MGANNTSAPDATTPDAIVVGAGLAGLVATHELVQAGKRVVVLDQENEKNRGGQAFWSLGGLFFVNSPEQRRWGIKDSVELALSDWLGSAQFDREEDHWPREWAKAYVEFAAGEKYEYLRNLGLRVLPFAGWAERGDGTAHGHGNSVPRFHLTWGTGPEIVRVFLEPVEAAERTGQVVFKHRHCVDEIITEKGAAVGVKGTVLKPDNAERGKPSNRDKDGDFELRSPNVIVTSGGIGHNFDLIRQNWPIDRLGNPPKHMVAGVPAHVDGRMIDISRKAGVSVINEDRMWHYTEGLQNWDSIWENHGIRIIPGPSSLWFDAEGNRLPAPNLPGFDSLGTLRTIGQTGYDYSWFITNTSIISKEFILSGSEQNPEITDKDKVVFAKARLNKGPLAAVQAFVDNGSDWVSASDLETLVEKMNEIGRGGHLDAEKIHRQVAAYDAQMDNKASKDAQQMAIKNARSLNSEKIIRVAKPGKILDPDNGPLIGIRLNILSRKTLGGLETNLDSQCLGRNGTPIPGLYAAGEVAGFGGGGIHGYNALEGTFLGGCVFSGRNAGRAAAKTV
jgi:predicted oxidoreductase